MTKLIAVIDDEPDILNLVMLHLKKASFHSNGFLNARSFKDFLKKQVPDLIILDIMLPDDDGFKLCKELRSDERYLNVPVIMLTAKAGEQDKIEGLETGADDYITKPFSPKELVARVRAVLRRSGAIDDETIVIADMLKIDPERLEVMVGDIPIPLTPVEFKMLHLFASNKGRVFSRENILDHLWGNEKAVTDRTIDVHIKNLRDKLGDAGNLIKNIRGFGYKLEE